MRLNPVMYNYKNWNSSETDRTKERLGFIAEEMNNIIPEVVVKQDGEIDSIDYSNLIPLAIKGIQEQQNQISNLNTKISSVVTENSKVTATTVEASKFKNTNQATPDALEKCAAGTFKFAEEGGKSYIFYCSSQENWKRAELSDF
jgi:isopentenyl diphosphate isomerase/L-lactate dehydrogenase-like FMN-dependent dehydrogenase